MHDDRNASGIIRCFKKREIYNKITSKKCKSYSDYYIIKNISKIFFPTEKIHVIKEDPSDNMFLDCAKVSGSKYIISRDRHLLDLKIFEGIKILTPENFISC